MPDGYIAVCHVVSNLVKKGPLRLSSCWTPISGSFESIVEEDEELNDEEGLETTERNKTDKTGTMFNCWYSVDRHAVHARPKKLKHTLIIYP